MNKLLSIFSSLLYNWNQNPWTDDKYSWIGSLYGVLTPILYAIMGVIGAAGTVYAIVLGVQLARADDQSKRDEAKKRLITVLVAVAVTIVLVLFFNEIFPLILAAFMNGAYDPAAAA